MFLSEQAYFPFCLRPDRVDYWAGEDAVKAASTGEAYRFRSSPSHEFEQLSTLGFLGSVLQFVAKTRGDLLERRLQPSLARERPNGRSRRVDNRSR